MRKNLGVLAGRDMPLDLLRQWAQSADAVFAADAGADLLAQVGMFPHWTVGDLDSLAPGERQFAVHLDPDQDSTDCDKLLAKAESEGLASITLAAVEGDQLDHMLATLHSAARSSLEVRIALRTGIGYVLTRGQSAEIVTVPGRRVSLLPLTATEGASLRGVDWPLEQSNLSPLGATSISNRANGELVEARILEGAAFLFVEMPVEEMPSW